MDAYSILLSVVMSTLPGPHDYTVQVMDRLWSCGSWCLASMPTLGGGGLYAGASGFLPKLKVESNERDGKSQWITVRVWIGIHPTCQTCRPVLSGEITLRCCIDSPSGCFNVLSAQGARLAIHVSLPTREDSRNFFFCLLIVLFSPFTISHDRTPLGADCFSRPLPFRTI